ncbi:MAG TPA: hotdog fold thioesterase [Puia sp.]|jgi:1,4-dihydroxy-2-naphthoyl-CoA hydrolase|nr:hotdog fold thioesterase [Puia sp.]
MPLWFNPAVTPAQVQPLGRNTMVEWLGIEVIEVGDDFLKARMPVDHRTQQPYGLLHGGASVTLAETLGSIASALVVDQQQFYCVGLEINANHVRSARNGFVTGIARPLHIGKTTHVWDIRIQDELDRLVCVSRLTVAIIKKES